MTRTAEQWLTARRAAVLGSPDRPLALPGAAPRRVRGNWASTGWSYDRFEVDEAALPGFLDGLGADVGRAVADHAAEAGGHPAARRDQRDGRLRGGRQHRACSPATAAGVGDNTDIPGMVAALRERGVEQVESAAVLGAGATASSALAALSRICTGAVTAYVRSAARAAEMRHGASGSASRCAPPTGRTPPRRCGAPLVIATTPAGSHGRPRRRRPGAPRHALRRALRPLADRARRRLVRRAAAPWSAASTCWCTRPCSRSSR